MTLIFLRDVLENHKSHSKAHFKRATGVELKTFKLMVKAVKEHDAKIVTRKGNRRSRPYLCIIEDQILLTLMYYREYRTQWHIGVSYGISEASVCRTIKRIENILKKRKEFKLSGKEKLRETNHQFEVVLIDATEQPIERPKKNNTGIIQEKRKSIH